MFQAGMDVLHAVDLGVWVHFLTAVAVRYKNVLSEVPNVLSKTEINNVWSKLNQRVGKLDSNVSLFRLNQYQSSIFRFLVHGKENPKERKKTYRSWEHHLLMMVKLYKNSIYEAHMFDLTSFTDFESFFLQGLPYLVKDLIREEVDLYNARLPTKPQWADKPKAVDPSPRIQYVFTRFLSWYNHIRQPKLNTEELSRVVRETYELKQLLKEVFPDKAGLLYFYYIYCVYIVLCDDLFCVQVKQLDGNSSNFIRWII